MGRGVREATVHGVAKSQTCLSDFHFEFPVYCGILFLFLRQYFFLFYILDFLQFCSVTQSCPTLSDPMNHSTPGLQYACLENPMDGGAWWAAVHGVAKSQTWLSDFTFTFHFHALEEEMATHSSVLAWRIPGTGEPGGLLSMGSHRVGHD